MLERAVDGGCDCTIHGGEFASSDVVEEHLEALE